MSGPLVRFDDLAASSPASWQFAGPIADGRAHSVADVRGCIDDADRAARDGAWVAVVVAYEAARAFDPAARTSPAPPPDTPYVWWTAFERRCAVDPPAFGPSPVKERIRSENVLPFPMAVDEIRRRIARGDVYQVNVTDRIRGHFTGDPYDLYRALTGVQTCAYAAFVDLGTAVVVSASPELFFRWDAGTVTCRPMKGTAPRQPRPNEDRMIAAELVASPKERAENVMIVDLLRNDLSRIADVGTVRVPELFTVERYETVWQLTSTIQGDVAQSTSLSDVFAALFPCGSVTGAPKLAAMKAIAELEREPRGVYCGAIGYLSPPGQGPRAVFSVPIRTAVADPATSTYVYGAGGGITWSSEPAAEDEEVRVKARILGRSRREFDLLETMRHDAAGVWCADRHLDRLAESAEWFGFPFDRSELRRLLTGLPPVDVLHRVRLLLASDGTARVQHLPLGETPSHAVRLAVDAVALRSDDPFCCHKTTFRRHYDEARMRHPGADDVLLVNEHGNVVETTVANLAYRVGGVWFVPPLVDGGLPGVGRAVALDEGRVAERSLPVTELAACDELAVVSALRGWRRARLA